MPQKTSSQKKRDVESLILSAALQGAKLRPEEKNCFLNISPSLFSGDRVIVLKAIQHVLQYNDQVDLSAVAQYIDDAGHTELGYRNAVGYLVKLLDQGALPSSVESMHLPKLKRLHTEEGLREDLHYILKQHPEPDEILSILQRNQESLADVSIQDKQPITLTGFQDLITDDSPAPDAIIGHGILNCNSIALLSGPPKSGKTILSGNLALKLAYGQNYFTFPIARSYRVLWLQAEVAYHAFRDRIQLMHKAIQKPLLGDLLVSHPFNRDIRKDADFQELQSLIDDADPDVVIFDPLIAFHTAEENSNEQMQVVMNRFRQIVTDGPAVILVHHSRKYTEGASVSNARGASAITGAVDSIINLNHKSDGKIAIEFDLRYDKAPSEMTMRLNPQTLWFEYVAAEDRSDYTADIITILKAAGDTGKLKKDIVAHFQPKNVPDRTIYENLQWMEENDLITTDGKKRNTRVFFQPK